MTSSDPSETPTDMYSRVREIEEVRDQAAVIYETHLTTSRDPQGGVLSSTK